MITCTVDCNKFGDCEDSNFPTPCRSNSMETITVATNLCLYSTMGASASMVQARLESDYGDEVGTWSDEMRDATIASITKTYESTLAATASPEEAYEAIKNIYLAAKRQAGKEHAC